MEQSIRRWSGAVCVVLAMLVPSGASAQDIFGLPSIEAGPEGITISPLPGFTIRLPGSAVSAPPVAEAPNEVPEPFDFAQDRPIAPEPTGTGRTVGVFVGISDYPGHGDLAYCASDALRVQQAFVNSGIMSPLDTVVLTDHQATRVAVSNAVDRMMRRLGPSDTIVFFFSGHGDHVADLNRDEQDGLDETISLYDGPVTDDELAALLASGDQRELVALDSCYSGGFARDVARLSDSVGFYASREDQLSYVASEHQAGGYLSYYFADAIARSQGRPLATWELRSRIADGFATSQAAGRQDLTWGVSRGVNTHTVLFARDRGDLRMASSRLVPSAI